MAGVIKGFFFMAKQVNTQGVHTDVYFSILSSIKENGKLPTHLYTKQNLNRYVQRLKRDKVIAKVGYGVWVLLKEPEQVNIIPQDTRKIRGHSFTFTIRIPRLANWSKRKEFLAKENIEYKDLGNYQRIIFRKHKIWLCSKSIVIYTPKDLSFYGITAFQSKNYALFNLESLITGLEGLFNCSFRFGSKYNFRISKQHYAKIKDALAEQYNKDKVKVSCYYNGEGWLVIDNSLGLNELETVHPKTSQADIDKGVIPFFNSLKQHIEATGEEPSYVKIMDMINEVVKDRVLYAQNIERHVTAITTMSKVMTDLGKEVKKVNIAQFAKSQAKLDKYIGN